MTGSQFHTGTRRQGCACMISVHLRTARLEELLDDTHPIYQQGFTSSSLYPSRAELQCFWAAEPLLIDRFLLRRNVWPVPLVTRT